MCWRDGPFKPVHLRSRLQVKCLSFHFCVCFISPIHVPFKGCSVHETWLKCFANWDNVLKTWGSHANSSHFKVKGLSLQCLLCNFHALWKIFMKFVPNVLQTITVTCAKGIEPIAETHTWRSSIWACSGMPALSPVPYRFSWNYHIEVMYRSHGAVTAAQCHTLRSNVCACNFISAPNLCLWRILMKLCSNVKVFETVCSLAT